MSIAGSQQRTFLQLVEQLRPSWRRDPGLPTRIQSLLASRREFGSRDRRLYRELIYTTLRYLPWIEPYFATDPEEATRRVAWLAAESVATRPFRAEFATGSPPSGDPAELLPAWFRAYCPEIFSGVELETQLRRAPVWLRLQTDAAGRERVADEFAAQGWTWRESELLPDAIQLLTEADVTKTTVWRDGFLEVQDLGSQLILESAGIERGGRWLDACAGAGGKTLQLARILGGKAQVDAHDIRPAALTELEHRATRARQAAEDRTNETGLAAIRIRTPAADAQYDGVLVDAPCSGSGTWRRSPHLKWVTTEADVLRAAATQTALLRQFSAKVKPGGRLIYATCSLSRRENEDVVAAFLGDHAQFRSQSPAQSFGFEARGNGLTIMPSRYDTDGFFVATFRRG
jgi:16S rRNA (cytosine967-C5)-methyltransferase